MLQVSVIITMPTALWSLVLLLHLTCTHRMSPGTNKSFAF